MVPCKGTIRIFFIRKPAIFVNSGRSFIPSCSTQNNSLRDRTISTSTPCLRRNTLKLMNFPKITKPDIILSIKNIFFGFLIKTYYDNTFSRAGFLKGAEQAITNVSSLISKGKFAELEGLVHSEAVEEIKRNYSLLSPEEQLDIAIDKSSIFRLFIYQIGMIFDELYEKDRRFVEVTVGVVSLPSESFGDLPLKNLEEMIKDLTGKTEHIVVGNYRFIREFTKGVESDWIINKLNCFYLSELMRNEV